MARLEGAMSRLRDQRQARVAAERVAAEGRFDAWERANRERAEEHRAASAAEDERRSAELVMPSAEYHDLQRRRAGDGIRAAIARALELSLAPDAILEIVHETVAKEAS
jgi:hypothetical protein